MKEATGELNLTVIAVVAIAAVAALFYAFIWPGIKERIYESQMCAEGAPNPDTSSNLAKKIYYQDGSNRLDCWALGVEATGNNSKCTNVGDNEYCCRKIEKGVYHWAVCK